MKMSRSDYARLFGPTTGDRVRLGDTSLIAQVERDLTRKGDELTTGAGKTMRDGEGFKHDGTDASGALDCVIQNALVLDPAAGVLKADIG
ncbi:MAG: urease subunit alpha, partial [Pseudomonadota bacterium]